MTENKRIFIVDDDQTVLSSLERLLELSGFEVRVTLDSREAVAKIKTFKPHLILLDLLMPGLGGMEVCEILNDDEETRHIPIIVISAIGNIQDIKKAYHLGVVSYLTKPYDFQELLKEITKALT